MKIEMESSGGVKPPRGARLPRPAPRVNPRATRARIGSGMGVWPCRAREAEPKIPGPCVRGARAGVSRAPLARPRAGGLRSRRLAIRSAGASLRLADSRGGHGAFATWPPRIVRISRLCRSANGKSTMVGIQCLQAFPSGEAASGRPPRGGVRSSPPLQGHERAGPHRLRAASRIAAPPPCSPRAHARFALSLAPCGRSRTAPLRLVGQPTVNSSRPTVFDFRFHRV